jgi:sigma-E factor negative regulatory protein RseC
MAEAQGTVTRRDGAHAFVHIREEGCGRCHEPGGCGGKSLTQALCSSPRIYRALNPEGAEPGDEVIVEISDRVLLHSAMAGYILPLLGLFLGAAIGLKCAGETASMLGAAGGLITVWGLQRIRWVQDILPASSAEPRIKQGKQGR